MEEKRYKIDQTNIRRQNNYYKFSAKIQYTIKESTILNSKASKKEEAIDYLIAEMERIDLHLEKLLAPQAIEDGQNEPNSHTEVQTGGTTYTEVNSLENII